MEGGSFRTEIRKRLLEDMLGAAHEASKKWSVLVVDELTVRILSKACTMTELMEAGVSCGSSAQHVDPFLIRCFMTAYLRSVSFLVVHIFDRSRAQIQL
eukprot:1410505-Pyramimonas_sp.AAC.2